MTQAIEHIVAGYVSLRDRVALEKIRDHRRKLLNEHRMANDGPIRIDWIGVELQEELGCIDVALNKL